MAKVAMKSKFTVMLISFTALFVTVQPMAIATPPICKKAAIASVNTSSQSLVPGDSLIVTFKGIGGGCTTGNFKVIMSSSAVTNA